MPPPPEMLRQRGLPREVTIAPCQPGGLFVGCAAHDGGGWLRELLPLRLPRAGTGPARDGLAPPLPPPPVNRPPSTHTTKLARPGGKQGWRFEGFAARRPLKKTARRRLSTPPSSYWPSSPVRMRSVRATSPPPGSPRRRT